MESTKSFLLLIIIMAVCMGAVVYETVTSVERIKAKINKIYIP